MTPNSLSATANPQSAALINNAPLGQAIGAWPVTIRSYTNGANVQKNIDRPPCTKMSLACSFTCLRLSPGARLIMLTFISTAGLGFNVLGRRRLPAAPLDPTSPFDLLRQIILSADFIDLV